MNIYEDLVRRIQPKVVVLGQALFLFPYPLSEMATIAHAHGARLLYDAAHVMGLIAGRHFQEPSSDGVDVLTSSTSKGLSASLGGLLMHNDDALAADSDEMGVWHVSGNNSARLASLAIVLAEHLEFGHAFYGQAIRNAQTLGNALHAAGFDIVAKRRGFTASHMILLECSRLGNARQLAFKMREANIILTPFSVNQPSLGGLRLGTTVCTRYGMGEPEMQVIASFFRRVLLDGESPASVAKDVEHLRAQAQECRFCFA